MLNDTELEAIEKRAQASFPGAMEVDHSETPGQPVEWMVKGFGTKRMGGWRAVNIGEGRQGERDAEFLLNAREDILVLLRELRLARAVCKEVDRLGRAFNFPSRIVMAWKAWKGDE